MVNELKILREELEETKDLSNYYKQELEKANKSLANLETRLKAITKFEETLGNLLKDKLTNIAESYFSLTFAIWAGSIIISCALIWGV